MNIPARLSAPSEIVRLAVVIGYPHREIIDMLETRFGYERGDALALIAAAAERI